VLKATRVFYSFFFLSNIIKDDNIFDGLFL